jgi:Tfp pilus assembly protein PilZ
VTVAGAGSTRILIVGSDAELASALHVQAESSDWALYVAPGPGDLETMIRAVSPRIVVLVLPPSPDASWGPALTTAQGASRAGIRVVMVAPSREVVEPLAAVAGAERALSRADVLAFPALLVDAGPGRPHPRPFEPHRAPALVPPPPAAPPPRAAAAPAPDLSLAAGDEPPPRAPARPSPDLMALIDDELVGEHRRPPMSARVEVSVSLVSEHNFYVGVTRRIDSGGVFIATSMPPAVGTRVQVHLGLADGRKLELEGEVAFLRAKSATTGRQPAGCGVRLHGVPGWAVDAIERFFQARLPIAYAAG